MMIMVILIVIQMTHTMIVTVIDLIKKLYLCIMHLINMIDIEIDMNQKNAYDVIYYVDECEQVTLIHQPQW